MMPGKPSFAQLFLGDCAVVAHLGYKSALLNGDQNNVVLFLFFWHRVTNFNNNFYQTREA